jgi:tubulin-specific chaperone E
MTDHATDICSSSIGPLITGSTRIRDVDGFVGTVVYLGPVASAKNATEVYAGVVWDDTSRGKHDGSVVCRTTNQVVRHFRCGPTQGSFVRLNKLDRGVALTAELLQSKYVELQAPVIAPNNILPHTALTASGREKPIEFLGELKIRRRQQLEDIHKVSLRREGISWMDSLSEEDRARFQNIRDIDLAGNLLSDWAVVLNITQQFPQLTDFSVAFNRIQDITLPPLTPSLSNMKVLNLNHCGINSFQSVLWVAKSMPFLESLCVASSDLSDLEQKPTLYGLFSCLKVLDCSDCKLTSWEKQVKPYFGCLSSLEQLSLDDNPISSITADDGSAFPALQALQLAGTAIAAWSDVDGVNHLNLRSLRLKYIPLTSNLGQGEVRFMAIARIPTLDYLNGSVVSTKERTEAERRYVTMIAHLLMKVERENAKDRLQLEQAKTLLISGHPQYLTLLEKHSGLILPSANQGSDGDNPNKASIASSVCNVSISSMAASSCSMEPLTRRLPGTLTVGRLKALCGRAFGLDVDLMSLHFRTEVRR